MITVIQKNYVQYMSCQRPSQVDCHGNEISIASAGAAGGGGGISISAMAWHRTTPDSKCRWCGRMHHPAPIQKIQMKDAKSRFMPFSDVDLFKYLNLCNKLPSDSFAIIPIIRYF